MSFVRPIAALLVAGALCICQERTPLLVVPGVSSATAAEQWNHVATDLHWKLILPTGDLSPQGLERSVREGVRKGGVDEDRVYLIGLGDAAPASIYSLCRVPHLWAAVVLINGNLKPLIQSNHLFAANSRAVPALWLFSADQEKANAWSIARLRAAGFRIETRSAQKLTAAEPIDWLASKRRDPAPRTVECETGAASFRRCYWLEIGTLDQAQRNDVLKTTRVQPGSGASLDLGGFGYNPAEPGPGVLVGWLPPNYNGPLKLEDRILSLAGKSIDDAAAYEQIMDQMVDEKPAAITVERDKAKLRIETRVLVAHHEETWTAQIRGEFNPETRELIVIARGAAEVELNLPQSFLPAKVNWNGTPQGELEIAGCYVLGTRAVPCLPKAQAPPKGPSAPPSLRRP